MTDKAISRFASAHDLASRPPKQASRRRVEDMTIRKLAPKTQVSDIRAVRNFIVFLGRSPDGVAAEVLRRYQLHLRSSGVSATGMNAAVSALRFVFSVTLGRRKAAAAMAGGSPSRASRR